MGQKITQANLSTGKYTDSQLIPRAQQVHDAMTANVITFPTADLPVSMANLQLYIDSYTDAVAAAIKGTISQTADKDNAKRVLVLALKQLALYVTGVATFGGTGTPDKNLTSRAIVALSGFKLSANPTPVDPISGIPAPQVRKAISEDPGSLKILVRQYTNPNRNTKLWQVNYRTSAIPGTPGTPAGLWVTQTFTGQNQILLTGLESGVSYDWQIAAIGGRDVKRNSNPTINFTPIESVVII